MVKAWVGSSNAPFFPARVAPWNLQGCEPPRAWSQENRMGAALFLGAHFQEFDPLPIEEGCVHIFEGKAELDPIDDFGFWREYPRILD